MTDPNRLTGLQLDEIDARAAHLYEYVPQPEEADVLAGTDVPALHAEVLAGALSTHAAMVKAGFRQRKVSIPVATPAAAAKALRRNLEPEQIKELVKLLVDD
ncbi:hypothetical protein [Streptomyces sp. NPDC001530]|uniref:hypothetical protein n=1 Tax=Streptomyces sp. NPDC001530 TaxID=3364582 RepID=UPI0036C67072